jgi:GH24 family phage-related lysozyme (muramidase)
MYQSVRDNVVAFQQKFEGRVPYMYLDVKGLVTVGIGNLIDDPNGTDGVKYALPLPFVWKADQTTAATQDDIATDWNAVKARQDLKNSRYTVFDAITQLMLTDDAIDNLVLEKADEFAATLQRTSEFSTFEDWPADSQLGLLSMAWAMGPAFAEHGWPKFRAACANGDWAGAAAECHITGPGLDQRNNADVTLFNNAADVVEQGSDYSVLQYQV